MYRDQINIEIIRAFLSDAKKSKYGALLSGTGSVGGFSPRQVWNSQRVT
jgi:hypothetical protein